MKTSTLNKFLKKVGLILLVICTATLIDWAVHSLSPHFYVTSDYYRNKIIFATIIGLATLWVFRTIKSANKKALFFSLIIAVTLQTKYFLLGYDRFFVFLFMFLHFGMFLLPALIIFKKYPEYF